MPPSKPQPESQSQPQSKSQPSVFCKGYADAYDLLYTDKDYEAECDMIEGVFRRYGDGAIKTILDLGCGTGNHSIPLAKRGYEVTGVDISPDMLAHAEKKSNSIFSSQPQPVFIQGDVRTVDLSRQFDAVLMMFAVLGYQTTNDDALAALHTVRRHLKRGGLFVCDVWYGPAVLTIRPSERVKVIPTAEGKIIRATSGNLDTFRHICEVQYHVLQINGKQVLSESEEKHTMRYFFPQELCFFLSQVNLETLGLFDFKEMGRAPTDQDWNVICIGRG